MTQANLASQLRIAINGPSVTEFHPSASVLHWLQAGHGSRHLTYKPRKTETVDLTSTAAVPSTSQSGQTTEQLAYEVLQKLTEEQKANFISKNQCCTQ